MPKPKRLTAISPPILKVPAEAAEIVVCMSQSVCGRWHGGTYDRHDRPHSAAAPRCRWDIRAQREDNAQKLATRELEGTWEARGPQRLVNVERALRKIEEGTYGLWRGKLIPLERLKAVPEALQTSTSHRLATMSRSPAGS